MLYEPLNYKISGSGSCVLFLHGWGGSMHSFSYFENKLAPFHTVINCDLYGFGNSKIDYKILPDIYTYALNIYLFLKSKNITSLSIVAHSFGGRIAIILASLFDLKINKLILTAAAGIKIKKKLSTKIRIAKYKTIKKIFNIFNCRLSSLNKYGSCDYKKLSTAGKVFFNKILSQDLTYLLRYIDAPTSLFWGEKDKSTPLKIAYIIKKHLPDSTLIVNKNARHFCYFDCKIKFLNLLYMLP